jgi:BNR repeat protein
LKHVTVYAETGMYAGWPANHGAWQWGEHFLVGFLRGPYSRNRSMHSIEGPFELMQARSLDGGETWADEVPGIPVRDEAIFQSLADLDLAHDIIRVRGSYDHGDDFVDPRGGFYYSLNRGQNWSGPFVFPGAEDKFAEPYHCTARTCVVLTAAGEQLVFLSRAERACWGTDDVLVFAHKNGCFEYRGELPSGPARCVMPAAVEINGRIVAVCRRRKTGRSGGWIEAFDSEDAGRTWRSLGEVGTTGRNNGNPPALIARGDEIVCCYGNRTENTILARSSKDRGETWSVPRVLREGEESDIGYPRLFKRADGKLVCVYYWASKPGEHQSIQATIFE